MAAVESLLPVVEMAKTVWSQTPSLPRHHIATYLSCVSVSAAVMARHEGQPMSQKRLTLLETLLGKGHSSTREFSGGTCFRLLVCLVRNRQQNRAGHPKH